ncbi:MAG: chemotaxis protein CheA [Methylococcaceae bacterium]|nr:MAG: chemotaxis protein CheA [Methylococcaceae bacterium]
MAIDLDDEILQDFLVEAGEILELLGEQLVELEQSPDDYNLLNAIFRGFHTVKGGAGFLAITPLVEICHTAEDVFNVLRQGDRRVTQLLMDVVLQALDVVNTMFGQIRLGVDPEPADAALLQRLHAFASPAAADEAEVEAEEVEAETAVEDVSPEAVAPSVPDEDALLEPAIEAVTEVVSDTLISPDEFESLLDGLTGPGGMQTSAPASDEISEEEFEALLDQLHGKAPAPAAPAKPAAKSAASAKGGKKKKAAAEPAVEEPVAPPPASAAPVSPSAPAGDEITDDEFELLLDELHGKGKIGPPPVAAAAPTASPAPASETPAVAAGKGASDEINDDEFEQLLDELHGKGKFTGAVTPAAPEPAAPVQRPVAATPPPDVPKPPPAPKPAAAKPAPTPASAPKPAPKPMDLDDEGTGKSGGKQQAQAETTVRVDTQRLDEIMNLVGELVLVRNRLQTLRATLNDEQISKAVENLDVVTSDLQLSVMKTRMQPIKKVFGRFPRVVRDLARSLKKEVNLELRGEETDLDKNLVEALADPLVHLVRNAVDHGVETPEEREEAGKPREGTVILTASQEGNHIQLTIEDDGKGMNPDILRRKAVEKGLMDEESAMRMDNRECFNLIFMPGFSTKTEISDVSGRGVGMDVVKTRIVQMNGTVEVESIYGKGSRIVIKLPLTLAIMPTLMVKLASQAFALPLTSVVEILDLDLNKTNVVDGQLVVIVRERALPLFYLGQWLIQNYYVSREDKQGRGHVVVVNASGRHIGFVVDHLIGQEEVVIKALGAKLKGVQGLAGATITGDGMIALILDIPGLVKNYVH